MALKVLLILNRSPLSTIQYFYGSLYSPPIVRHSLVLSHVWCLVIFLSCYSKRIPRTICTLQLVRQARTVVQKLTACIVRNWANCWHFLQLLWTLSQILNLLISDGTFCLQFLALFGTWTLHLLSFFDELVDKSFVYNSEFGLIWFAIIVSSICSIEKTVIVFFIFRYDLATQ